MLTKTRKMTTGEVAETYRRHPVTVRIALQSGALHGRQRTAGGRWLIDEECAEAWFEGVKCKHQTSAPIHLSRKAS